MVIFNALTIFVGLATIGVNILIARYNIGKNRLIYAIEEITVDRYAKDCFRDLNAKLNSGKYTILNSYQDARNSRNTLYLLGKVQ